MSIRAENKTGTASFDPIEATFASIQGAYASGQLTVRGLVETYLRRIEAIDRNGPKLNAIISVNPSALNEADALDATFAKSGPVGPLHGIPLVMKDQADVMDMPTTMGSILFRDHMPQRDCFVAAKLKAAGALFIAKTTLGELGAGDTHGSLFGSTRCVYDLERTAGGSSGGSGVAASANLCAAAIGQEGLASIRRPSTWNGIVGMRPTAGLVSRGGVYAGWPSVFGSLGPMTRTVLDAAKLLDAMTGYDPRDPVTALGVGHAPASYAGGLNAASLKGARLGVLRNIHGYNSDPAAADFNRIEKLFDRALGELRTAGVILVDIEIPALKAIQAKRANEPGVEELSYKWYLEGSASKPYASMAEAMKSPLYPSVTHGVKVRWEAVPSATDHYEYLKARDELMFTTMNLMAQHALDAIVHKAVEHEPTLISEGIAPPFTTQKGSPVINTFLTYVPTIVIPAGFTESGLPGGITFLGRPYSDAQMLSFAYAYEQATHHRKAPEFPI
ncbi:MAG: amidase [Alphaproteobacteria bacterium]|nr:amidase [Alphaproteobacteria bacterium]